MNSGGIAIVDDVNFKYRYDWGSYYSVPADGELLPVSTKFTVTYRGTSIERSFNLQTSPVVSFNTGKVEITLTNGVIADAGFKYRYDWEALTAIPFDGTYTVELLPKNTKFTCNYEGESKEKSAVVVASTTTIVNFTWDGAALHKSTTNTNDYEDSFTLSNVYPNPFSTSLTIEFNIPEASDVTISVFEMSGRLVKTIFKSGVGAGNHTVVWDGTNVNGVNCSSSSYMLHVSDGKHNVTRRIILAR